MANQFTRNRRSDQPAIWAVIAFAALALSINSYMFAPRWVESVTGETIFTLLVLTAVIAAIGVVMLCIAVAVGWTAAKAAPAGSIQQYFRVLRVPIAVVLITAAVSYVLHDESWTLWASLGARLCAAILAGWSLARHGYSVWNCAMAGVFLIFLDHVIVNTFAFSLTLQWRAIGGVLISFAMFAFIPMAVAAGAGLVAKRIDAST